MVHLARNYNSEWVTNLRNHHKRQLLCWSVTRKVFLFRVYLKVFRDHDIFTGQLIFTEFQKLSSYGWVWECASKGFPRRKENVQTSGDEFIQQNRYQNLFKNRFPGGNWCSSFLERQPDIARRMPEGVLLQVLVSANEFFGDGLNL